MFAIMVGTSHASSFLKRFSWWDYDVGAFHLNQGLRIGFPLAIRAVA
jgi:hypothetical protein